MTFARPEALALLALLLPIVALFLVRPRAQRTVVGSLLLWKRVQGQRARRASLARLEKIVSLLLHAGALAAIVFALARPLGGEALPRRIVAVLDASGSMSARLSGDGGGRSPQPIGADPSRFAVALEGARRLAASLGPEDELGFVLAGRSPRVLLAPVSRAVHPETALEHASLEGGTSDLRSALELAYALVASTPAGREREVWLYSDGAAPELSREPRPRPPEGTRLRYARLGSPRDASVGVVAFAAREVPGSAGEVEVEATLASSFAERVAASATLLVGGEPVVTDQVELEPGARLVLPSRRIPLERGGGLDPSVGSGILELKVATAGDVLARDDEAWLVIPGGRRPVVALEGAGSAARFVRAALEADEGVRIGTTAGSPDRSAVDVAVLAGESVPAEPPRAALLVGEAAARAAAANPAWDLVVRGDATGPRASVALPAHPLIRHVLLEPVLFARAATVQPGPSWQIVAGEPPLVLVREDASGRRAVLLPFSPEETDLVLRRAWPLLVSNAVRWLAGQQGRESQPTVRSGEPARVLLSRRGESASGESAAGESATGESAALVATVFSPSGARTVVPLELGPEGQAAHARQAVTSVSQNGEATLAFTGTTEVGIYSVVRGERAGPAPREPNARFAVSLLDEDESRVAARVELGLGEEPALEPRPRGAAVETPALLATLAVLLLALEGYLFHRRGLT